MYHGAASPKAARALSPSRPRSCHWALASVSLTLVRSTNIDSRLSVWASRSCGMTSSTVSGAVLITTKLACMRPLALQNAASLL